MYCGRLVVLIGVSCLRKCSLVIMADTLHVCGLVEVVVSVRWLFGELLASVFNSNWRSSLPYLHNQHLGADLSKAKICPKLEDTYLKVIHAPG